MKSHKVLKVKELKQGCCLSAAIINIYIDQALHHWKRKCAGVGIQMGERVLHILQYACLISTNDDMAAAAVSHCKQSNQLIHDNVFYS